MTGRFFNEKQRFNVIERHQVNKIAAFSRELTVWDNFHTINRLIFTIFSFKLTAIELVV